jgi:hypothetical protein
MFGIVLENRAFRPKNSFFERKKKTIFKLFPKMHFNTLYGEKVKEEEENYEFFVD